MDDVSTLWRTAQARGAAGDLAGAEAAFAEVVARVPAHAPALLQLSYLESLKGRYLAARTLALRAAAAQPRDPMLVAELMARLRTFNEADALHDCVRRLPPKSGIPIQALLAIGAQLSYYNEQAAAIGFMDEAARADPDFPPTLVARAQVLIYLGKFERARADLEKCVARAPRIAQAWWLLSRLGIDAGRTVRIGRIRALLKSSNGQDDHAVLQFALHNELDAVGDHAAAWSALEAACAAKRAMLRYDPAATTALVDRLIDRWPQSASGEPMAAGAIPIFIVGMHRSGTTLLEDRLDRHPQVTGLGELYDFTHQLRAAADHHCRGVLDSTIVERIDPAALSPVGRGYVQGVAWRAGKAGWTVDKLPSNFLSTGFICDALPQARLLHMRRDPMETCFSNLRELFSDACPYSYDMAELAHYYREYRRLMAHWRTVYPDRMMDVDYAALVANTEETMRTVAGFCGFDFDPAMVDTHKAERGVATASAVQVRGRLVLPKRPKWHAYERWLAPLQDLLAD